MRPSQVLAVLALLPCSLATAAADAPPGEVLVVVNGASEVSRAIGRYYARQRGIPPARVFEIDLPPIDTRLATPRHETVPREVFVRAVRDPLAAWLAEHDPERRIRVLVTTKGVPLRIREPGRSSPPFSERTWASVDAELALLGSGVDGSAGPGSVPNPYFARDLPFGAWRERHPDAPLRYLVARLTGYPTPLDPETGVPRDVKRLVDAATGAAPGGPWVIDEDPEQKPMRRQGNRAMLAPAASALRAQGLRVRHDTSPAVVRNVARIAGYASWGSNDRHAPGAPFYGVIGGDRHPGTFADRAVVIDLVSTNARSFAEPARYGQSLVADLVRAGAAGAAGHVYEPTLSGVPRPYLLLAHYAAGAPAIEAYFRSVPYLGWTNVWIGDPGMRVRDPAPLPADRDGDGVPDVRDTCLWLPDPDQRDTNGDGFGNLCDPDVDGDGRVRGGAADDPRADLSRIARSAHTGLYVPDHDLDGDGQVDDADLGLAQLWLHLPPGPSGRSRASDEAPMSP